jgi:hypothetical protein
MHPLNSGAFSRDFSNIFCKKGFDNIYDDYTNIASTKHLCRRVVANTFGKPK